MKIEEAIKTNTALAKELDVPQRAKERKAVKLGIEALKLIQLERKTPYSIFTRLLSGETKD